MSFKQGDKVTYNRETWIIEWVFASNLIISRLRKDIKEELISSATAKRSLKLNNVKRKTNYIYIEVKKTRCRIKNLKLTSLNKLDDFYR